MVGSVGRVGQVVVCGCSAFMGGFGHGRGGWPLRGGTPMMAVTSRFLGVSRENSLEL